MTKAMPGRPQHQGLMNELKAVLRKHGEKLTAEELLAVSAQLVGQLVAMQDQRKYNAAVIMDMVAANIEEGNRVAVSGLRFGDVAGSA